MEKVKLTKEMREQLMGVLPFSVDARHDYVPEMFEEVPKKYQPIFTLRPFTQGEIEETQRLLKKKDNLDEDSVENMIRLCVVGWKNLIDLGEETIVEYKADKDGGADKDLWTRIPKTVKSDFVNEIFRISGLMKSDKLGLRS